MLATMVTSGALALAMQAASQPPQTLQQRFDAASKAAAEGRCAEAITAFEAVEATPTGRRGIVGAAINVRKGGCLILRGEPEAGEATIRKGLPVLERAGDEFKGDVRAAYLQLAASARRRLDYASAITDAERALALSEALARIQPLLMLAALKRFDGDGAAERHAFEASSLAGPDATPDLRARIGTEHGRVLLNAGRTEEAYAELRKSLTAQGGLTLRTTLSEVATRGDLALAADMTGDREAARKYLAYTGAGRISEAPFTSAAVFEAPPCGLPGGPTRDDHAIIEFGLHEKGWVAYAEPIYVTGGRSKALAFAQAVLGWSWSAESASKVPAFYRAATRIELRCTEAGDRLSLLAPLNRAVAEWLELQCAAPIDPLTPDARLLLEMQRAIDSTTATPSMRLQAALWLATSPLIDAKASRGPINAAETLARTLEAPVVVHARIAIQRAILENDGARGFREAARALLAQPDYAGDPMTAATLRLETARSRARSKPPEDAARLIDAVVADDRLEPTRPLRINALLQRADLAAGAGDVAKAQQSIAATGLTAQQCAVIGVAPAARGHAISYPEEAINMGFEGWVRLEFDVTAKGRATNQRALMAYPPRMFSASADEMARAMWFSASHRPDTEVACSATQQTISFRMP
ncbi:TonB family protein [Sphingomonas baiyangensis]|nr:TonB family protein [Sphingomonas baiyangensis]